MTNANANANALMSGPPSEADRARLAVIRAHFESANVDVPLDAPMKERTARVSAGIGLMTNGREYTEFLLSLVGVLEGQLATARALVADLVDGGKCWFDHNGHCQDHGWFETEPACPHGRAKALGLDGGGSHER